MITLKDIGRLIQEEVKLTLEADTRIFGPGERAAASRARKRREATLTPEEREVIRLTHDLPRATRRKETVFEPPSDPQDLANKIRQQTEPSTDHKSVESQDVAAFKMYRKLHYDLLDFTEEQQLWMAGDVAGRGVIPRKVLRQEVPEILDAIEKVENNEVDPDLQDRLSRYQSAPGPETPKENQARRVQYNRAHREFNLWRDKPYSDLNKWLRTSHGMDFAIQYNTFDIGGDEEEEFPGGGEATESYKEIFDDKIAIEQHLLDKGYNVEQLSYYLQDPEGRYGKA